MMWTEIFAAFSISSWRSGVYSGAHLAAFLRIALSGMSGNNQTNTL